MKKFNRKRLLPLSLTGLLLLNTSCTSLIEMLPGNEPEKELAKEEADRYNFIKKDRNEDVPVPSTAEQEEIQIKNASKENGWESDAVKLPAPQIVPLAERQTASGKKNTEIKADPFYADLIVLNADEEIPVQIALNSAPVIDALPAFADVLGFNFIVDSDIKSVITINVDSMMTRQELWETVDELLYMAGCTAILKDQVVRIMPIAKFGTQRDIRIGANNQGGAEVVFYPLKNLPAATALELIQPFAGTNCIIKPVSGINALLLADDAGNMQKLTDILNLIDTAKRSLWPRTVIRCENVVPTMVSAELAALLPVLGFSVDLTGGNSTQANQQAGAVQLMGIDRLQMLVVSAATEEALNEIKEWVKILDASERSGQERVYVYKVTNGKAEQLAQALATVFNITSGTSMSVDSAESVGSNSNTRTIASNSSDTSNSVDNLSNTLVDRNSSVFETPVRMFADGVYNRLVIRTTPRCYAMVKALLDRLDVVPAQVLIQILLAEVTLDNTTEFGVEFSYSQNNGDADSLLQTNYDGLKPENGAGEGFSYLITNPDNPDEKFGYLRAKAGKSKLKVISSPQVLVSSNSEAVVQVGQSVPIQTESITNTASSGSLAQSFQYRDVGIILTITPQVTSNDLISFEISQEISETTKNTASTIDSPAINVRKVTSTMTIANGRPMILGGLIQEKKNEELNSVPLIADIPIINSLLGKTDTTTSRSEVLMMITGYVINERSPVEDMLRRYNESVRALNSFENDLEAESIKDDIKLSDYMNNNIVVELNQDHE